MHEGTQKLARQLEQLQAAQQLRACKTITTPQRPAICLNQQSVVDFCSNDYLGLSQHPVLLQAAQEALAQYGTGTGGARLIGGTLDIHQQLEQCVAEWKQTQAALVYNSGYQANVSILSALASRHDVIFSDKLNHASLLDGVVLSRAYHKRYSHLDMAALERQLQQAPATTQKWIVTDSVFSMDGDLAPLPRLYQLACQYDTWLLVDEAHGSGVFGPRVSGLWEQCELPYDDRVIHIGTFSKALGSFGAYVAASHTVVQSLMQYSRGFIYSTSLPPATIAANRAAVQFVQTYPKPVKTLWENLRFWNQQALLNGLPQAQSPIIPVVLGKSDVTLQLAQQLLQAGFFAQAIRPPTVPHGSARLRITLSALHTPQHILDLQTQLATLI